MEAGRHGQDIIAKSRSTLAAWDWMSTLSRRPEEVLRLLQDEVHALETLAMESPRNAPAAAQLIAAYSELTAKVRQRADQRHAA